MCVHAPAGLVTGDALGDAFRLGIWAHSVGKHGDAADLSDWWWSLAGLALQDPRLLR